MSVMIQNAMGKGKPPQVCRSFDWIGQRIRCAIWLHFSSPEPVTAALWPRARISQKRSYKVMGRAGTRTRNQPRMLSGLLDQSVDCKIEIAAWGLFFRFRVCSSLRALVIDGSSFARSEERRVG